MSDSDDIFEGGEAQESESTSKKRSGGAGNFLPTILKFVGIGLGALIFIVTVSVVTYNIMNGGGKQQTVVNDPTSPYVGTRPIYSFYDMIGSISVRTKDYPVSSSVTVEMIIGYDENDQIASTELIGRRYELRDFVRRYFSGKSAVDLAPEREEELKAEIREMLNTRFLDKARARIIIFTKLDVMENY
ncbi:MAG: flagellar basal body protein FliL [Treponema sp.]|nr:flagellar basal body protein FliL [Treponema sp.]